MKYRFASGPQNTIHVAEAYYKQVDLTVPQTTSRTFEIPETWSEILQQERHLFKQQKTLQMQHMQKCLYITGNDTCQYMLMRV